MEAPSKSLQRSAAIAGVIAVLVAFPYTLLKQMPHPSPGVVSRLFEYPSVLFHLSLESVLLVYLGALIQIAIASTMVRYRNPSTRLRICRGWAIAMTLIVVPQLPGMIAAI